MSLLLQTFRSDIGKATLRFKTKNKNHKQGRFLVQ
jgi:hypothetical protein